MKSILVVDDEPHATRLLKLRLEAVGYRVDLASNGEEALEKIGANSYDALLTDICMPRMTGRELCTEVRKQSANDAMVIFVITSRPEDEYRSWTRDLENLEFFEKPVSIRRLIETIGRCLDSGDVMEARVR